MHDTAGFCLLLAEDRALSEADISIVVCWFLSETSSAPITFDSVVQFIGQHHVRSQPNKSRLRANLKRRKDVSLLADGRMAIPLRDRGEIADRYGQFLESPSPEIQDSILVMNEFEGERPYVMGLARQINACHQFHIYDGCAVLMRRLIEVLIIEAYERNALGEKIRDGSSYMMLAGILGALNSGEDFRTSRSAARLLEKCKDIGDTAAHSRNYLTKKIDIEDYAQEYRRIVDEMKTLVPRAKNVS